MGAGDRHMQKSFSVSMPGADVDWPLSKGADAEGARHACGECGRNTVPGSPHLDARDAGRPRRRVCFGKVVAK